MFRALPQMIAACVTHDASLHATPGIHPLLRSVLALALLLACLPIIGWAHPGSDPGYQTASVAFTPSEDSRAAEDGFGFTLGLGLQTRSRFDYEAEIQYQRFEQGRPGTPEWRELGLRGSILYWAHAHRMLSSFIEAGVAVIRTDRMDAAFRRTGPAFDLGIGVQHQLGVSPFSLRVGLRYRSYFYRAPAARSGSANTDFFEPRFYLGLRRMMGGEGR